MRKYISLLILLLTSAYSYSQDASPTVSFYDTEQSSDVTLQANEAGSSTAPLEITCTGNITPNGYDYVAYWDIQRTTINGTEEILQRYEDDTNYTLTLSGSYSVYLNITFTHDGDTIIFKNEPITITIAESSLQCPNGFSPNGDRINDVFNIKCKSIIKLDAKIFNRWGKLLYTMNLDNYESGWDGRVGGKVVKDGIYFVQVKATGSDGLKYNIKRTVSVLKGLRENENSGTTEN